MFISVIIPTFNREAVIQRAIDSVLAQSFKNFELIIVDDGSTDDTLKRLETYGDKIKVVTQENAGVSAARNAGIRLGKGDWFAFLDSDDEWLTDRLQSQVDYILENPEVPLVHGEEIWIRRGKRVNQRKIHEKGGGDQFIQNLRLCLISPSASIIRRDILEKWNGFDEDFPVCEDYDLWLKITSEHKIGFIKEPIIIKHGGHDDQLSARFFAMDFWRLWSMMRLLDLVALTSEKRHALLKESLRKSEILIKGYEKHENMENYAQVKNWKNTISSSLSL